LEAALKIVLGIDPGSAFTGFGVVRSDGRQIEHLSHGVIAPPGKLDFNRRIAIIAEEIEILIERIQPDVAVVERIFLAKNADSAFKLGHVRGAIIAALVRGGCEVVEYATRSVKKGITGNGGSSKEQVQTILFAVLGIRTPVQMDASDALALAFYHAKQIETLLNLEHSRVRRRSSDMEGKP
jgi:crossover junction endodeoxyribonuclease RuvC